MASLLALCALLFAGCTLPPVGDSERWPTKGWHTSAPEEQGMDSQVLGDLVNQLMEQRLPVHSLLVVRHGAIVLEAYFYPNQPEVKHRLWSLSKAVTSAVTGIAVGQGKLSLDQRVLPLFGDRVIANVDERKQAITVRSLLTMTSGLAWDETSRAYGDPTNSETQMTQSKDWVQFVLDRPMAGAPGSNFTYSSGAVQLLGATLQQATGMSEADYAARYLFAPLGITDYTWPTAPGGATDASVGLSLVPRDMAKIGYLYLHDGRWEGQQVLPEWWVRESTRKQAGPDPGFGYQWRVAEPQGFSAVGWGSQLIAVAPAKDLVVVMTAGVAPGSAGAGLEGRVFATVLQQAVKSDNALPDNPQAQTRLLQLVRRAAQPDPKPVPPLPPIVSRISGRVYDLANNAEGYRTLQLTFAGAEATLTLGDHNGEHRLAVGLDNVYRTSEMNGQQMLSRGAWQDPQTFVVEEQVPGAADKTTYTLRFSDTRVDGDSGAAIEEHRVEFHGVAR